MNQIVWFTSDNANTNLNNFESGDWLFIQEIPTNEMDRVKKELASSYHVAPIAGTFYVCININKDFLSA
jgi:oligopeptide transport system substrate-binding protein